MKGKADKMLVICFVSVLFVAFTLFVVLPKSAFSETENRNLQKLPRLSWDRLWSKKVTQEAEDYVIDHFPFRDRLVWVKSAIEQLRLKQENNGIYKGKEGYLLKKFDEPDYMKLASYADAVKKFALAHPETEVSFLLAPTSIGVYPNFLPWKAPTGSQDKAISYVEKRYNGELSFMSGLEILTPHKDEEIYYHTDHHWNTYGAFLAYQAYAQRMGWEPLPESAFDKSIVSDSFLGSYHTKGQFAGIQPDKIEVFTPKKPVKSSMYVLDTDKTYFSLYAPEFLQKKDQYSYFLGGVHALSIIKSELSPADKKLDKLLVLKDSYSHCFIPFLTSQVSEIHVIDLRYFNGGVGSYMKQNGIKDVLVLYNVETLVQNGADFLKLR